ATYLVERHAHEILSREEVQIMINHAREAAPNAFSAAAVDHLPLSLAHQVLQGLLREGVPLRPFDRILEKLIDGAHRVADAPGLLALVRQSLAHPICVRLAGPDGVLVVRGLAPALEADLLGCIASGPFGAELVLGQQERQALLVPVIAACRAGGVALVVAPALRPHLQALLAPELPGLHVLSDRELHPAVPLRRLAPVIRPLALTLDVRAGTGPRVQGSKEEEARPR
ncbi:MAG: flhA, partial [Cyanobacteria bacterium RYN_339]|nr:flhA [Cyanobacteria bacterium RYN_339]